MDNPIRHREQEKNSYIRDISRLYVANADQMRTTRAFSGLMMGSYQSGPPRHVIELIAVDQRPLLPGLDEPTEWNFSIAAFGPEHLGIEVVKRDTLLIQHNMRGIMSGFQRKSSFTRGLWVKDFHGRLEGGSTLFSTRDLEQQIGGPAQFLEWLGACVAFSVAFERRGSMKPCKTCPNQLACATEILRMKR